MVKLVMPETEKREPGVVVAMPTKPLLSIINAVDVAEAVEVEIAKTGAVVAEAPAIESLANGDVVPIPRLPVLVSRILSDPPPFPAVANDCVRNTRLSENSINGLT